MPRVLLIGMALAVMLLNPIVSPAQEVKYWKYKLQDVNWFPVYRNELPGPEANKATYWKVTYDLNNRPVIHQRIIRGSENSYTTYEYPKGDLPLISISYNNGRKIGHAIYEWDGPHLRRKISYDSQGNETESHLYSSDGDYYKSKKFIKGKESGESFIWYINDDNIIYNYIWNVSKIKYYIREYDTTSGLWTKSDCYINDKLDFTQHFSYDETGIQSGLTAFTAKGAQYSDNIYEDGLRMVEKYYYTDGVKEVFEYHYGGDRLCDFITCKRNNSYVYKIVFENDSQGNVIKSLAYDPQDNIFAEFVGYTIYLDRNGMSREGVKGNFVRPVELW